MVLLAPLTLIPSPLVIFPSLDLLSLSLSSHQPAQARPGQSHHSLLPLSLQLGRNGSCQNILSEVLRSGLSLMLQVWRGRYQ